MVALSLAGARGKRVLVVDDEQDIRDVLQILLDEEALEVRTAENGERALAV